jgi:Carboxypeptidase regulatory-like domain
VEFRLTLALVLILSAPIRAQTISGQGALSGTVRDDSGAFVADAKLILTEESKGLVREGESSHDGSFLFPSLIAGAYSLRAEKEGFSAEQMTGLRIGVSEVASIDLILHVGEIRTAIEVVLPTSTAWLPDLTYTSNTPWPRP